MSDAADLQELRDRMQLDDLITTYANCLDDRNWPGLADLFTPDAVLDFTGAYGRSGQRDEIVTWLEAQVTRSFVPEIQHFIANRRWQVAESTATGRADFFNPDVVDDGQGGRYLAMHGGRYTFEATRTGAGWRLSGFVGTVVWSHRGELLVFEVPEPSR